MRLVLLVLFIVVPLVELFVILQVGQLVGPYWTVAALLAISVAGAALVKREGTRAWSRFRDAIASTRLPAEEVTDGALVLLAGALLLTPGFVTDGVGFLLLLPPTRAVINRALRSRVRLSMGLGPAAGRSGPTSGRQPHGEGDDLEIDIVDVRRTEPGGSAEPDGLGRGDRPRP
jgi:UPF0716 protein FxsA